MNTFMLVMVWFYITDFNGPTHDGTLHEDLVGVVMSTTKVSKPSAGIMTLGVINNNALKYPFSEAALAKLASIGIHNQVD